MTNEATGAQSSEQQRKAYIDSWIEELHEMSLLIAIPDASLACDDNVLCSKGMQELAHGQSKSSQASQYNVRLAGAAKWVMVRTNIVLSTTIIRLCLRRWCLGQN